MGRDLVPLYLHGSLTHVQHMAGCATTSCLTLQSATYPPHLLSYPRPCTPSLQMLLRLMPTPQTAALWTQHVLFYTAHCTASTDSTSSGEYCLCCTPPPLLGHPCVVLFSGALHSHVFSMCCIEMHAAFDVVAMAWWHAWRQDASAGMLHKGSTPE